MAFERESERRKSALNRPQFFGAAPSPRADEEDDDDDDEGSD